MTMLLEWLALNFDLPILLWIREYLWCPFLDAVMPVITVFGDAGIFWIACAVVMLIVPKTRKTGMAMALALIMGLLLCNVTLKPLIARIRPYDLQLEKFQRVIPLLIEAEHDFSFPSGHTIASFEASVALLLGNKKLGIPAVILAAVIAFSRLYLYVHYPTDVLFSLVLGVGIALLATWLVKKGYVWFEARKVAAK